MHIIISGFEKFELDVLTIELKKLLRRASENRREERKGCVVCLMCHYTGLVNSLHHI